MALSESSPLDAALAKIIGQPSSSPGTSDTALVPKSSLLSYGPDTLQYFQGTGPKVTLSAAQPVTQTAAPATAAPAAAVSTVAAPTLDLASYKADYAAGKYKDKPWLDPVAQQVYTQYGQPGNESGDINASIKEIESFRTAGDTNARSLIDPNTWGTYIVPEKRTAMQDAYRAAGGLNLQPVVAAPVDPKLAAWQAKYDQMSKDYAAGQAQMSRDYAAKQAQIQGGGGSSPGVPTGMSALADWKKTHAWTQGPGGQILTK
jgi:hypothetical protein